MQERDNKENELSKCKAELAALGVAAKQGVEAATKVKTLETDNKKLTDENKVLTENFNSERVGLNRENCLIAQKYYWNWDFCYISTIAKHAIFTLWDLKSDAVLIATIRLA